MAQYSKHYEDFLPQEKTNFEVVMIADNFGNLTAGTGATATDAFGRLRVAETFTLGDYKHIYAIDPNFLDVKANGGDIQFTANKAAATMTTTSNVASSAVHQTKFYHHYQPGKSQVIFSSVCFGYAQQNVTKRTGYFDDRDGIYFEQVGGTTANGTDNGTLNFVVRSYTGGSASEATVGNYKRRVPQSEWNIDPCDGTGPSKFNINTSKTQLVYIDFQWLGVGRIRCGFVHNGQIILAHEYYCSNELAEVYMSNPNLPVRCEIRNSGDQVGAGGSFIQICSTVMSEGGYTESGREFSHTTGLRPVGIGTTVPIMAIRLKNSFKGYPNRATVKLEDITVFSSGSNVKYEVVKLKSSTGINTTGEWISEHPESVVEYNITAVGISTTDFEDFMGGYAAGDSQNVQKPSATTAQVMSGPTSKKNFLSQNFYSNDSEIFSVRVSNIGNDPANVGVSMRWREIY